jgi:predicted XRE-type DNA-binding protein
MSDAPSPENNLILRQLAEIRRENRETQERQARVIELLGRTNQKIDDLVARMERGLSEVRSDIVLLENKALSAITGVERAMARMDEHEVSPIR